MVDSEPDTPDGFAVDPDNPKYRTYKSGGSILEYTLDGREITIDWICGRDTALLLQSLLAHEGNDIEQIAGYVTDRLGSIPPEALQRFAGQVAFKLGGSWKVTIQIVAGRRYLIFTSGSR